MKIIIALLLAIIKTNSGLYDILNSSVQRLNSSNFNQIVKKGIQNDNIYIVHYYEPNDGQSYKFSEEFSKMAEKLKGIITLAFINCKENQQLCKQEVKEALPKLVLYPPILYSKETFDLKLSDAVNKGMRYLQSYVRSVTDSEILAFIKTDTQLPKVMVFTDNDRTPVYIQALSKAFKGKMIFG